MNNQKIIDYVNDQINRADVRAKAYITDEAGKTRAKRSAFLVLNKYLNDYTSGRNTHNRWVAISGLRGTGKTTLLAQLYSELDVPKQRKLFVSADHIVQLLDSSIADVVQAYESIVGESIERVSLPVYLFIDEVQYDSKWAIALKTLYDRSKNIFILSTGSSALEINTNPDTARRVITETLLPMSFTEYQTISTGIYPSQGLGASLRAGILDANTAQDIYRVFADNKPKIAAYWAQVDSHEIPKYLQYGTLPFMAATNNPAIAFDQLERSIDRILSADVAKIGQFNADTIARIPQILYSVADSDALSLNSMSNNLNIPRPTLTRIFGALEVAEVLFKLEPQGSHTSQIRQAAKYVFTTPAIRAMYFSLTGSTRDTQQVLGHLLEDTVAMYLRRMFKDRSLTSSINYSSQAGTADFIVRNKQVVYAIEVGYGKKTTRQIENTKNLPANRIGILLSSNELAVDPANNIVTVPIKEFLLI